MDASSFADFRASHWRGIGIVVLVLGAFAINSGFIYPALSLLLDHLGYSAADIGGLGSTGAVGFIVGSLLAPLAAQRLGVVRTAVGSVLATAVLIAGFAVVPPLLAWHPMRFLHGLATTLVFTSLEATLVNIAPQRLRGRIVGVYTTLNSAFFATGPWLVAVLDVQTALPFMLVAGLIALLSLPLTALGSAAPSLEHVPWRQLLATVASLPLLLIVILLWGWIDGAILNLWVVFAAGKGADPGLSARLLALLAVGNIVLQIPVGWIADRLPRRLVLSGVTALGVVLSGLLAVLDIGGLPMQVLLLLYGPVGFSTYAIALMALGDLLAGAELIAANAALGLCWGAGALAGSYATGVLIDAMGANGFPLALGGAFLLQWVATLSLPLRRQAAR